MSDFLSFQLPDSFVDEYKDRHIEWGFDIGGGNSLSELIYVDKYSALKDDGTKERWHETVRRVVEGYYSILKDHCIRNRTPWNDYKALASAKDAYERIFAFKWCPPGRGLQHMGRKIIHETQDSSPLQSCAFLSTSKLSHHSAKEATSPFVLMMEMSMTGIGVGYDLLGAGRLTIHEPTNETEMFIVPDTREGWAQSVGKLLETFFFKNRPRLEFDYSNVRPSGALLKTFGGRASGPGPLMTLHESLVEQFSGRGGESITSRDILDVMNKIGSAVVAGGARRSAQIALGLGDDEDFISAKDWNLEINKERTDPKTGWAHNSNNSVALDANESTSGYIESIAVNGEPGFVWLDTMRAYSRLIDQPDDKDYRVMGVNPCGEQSLEYGELCCLVETFPCMHETYEDYRETLKHAYLYGKAVTLLPTRWPETNEVMARNRRIGCSMSGLAEFVENRGWGALRQWMDDGYAFLEHRDRKYSEWLAVRESIKRTSVKPSGTTSLLTCSTPGVHWPVATGNYIRRVRFNRTNPLVEKLTEAGYEAEPADGDPDYTVVFTFITEGPNIRNERQVSIWEKAELAAMAQRWWSDNCVSATITFTPEERDQIEPLLASKKGQFKTLSFLPLYEEATYPQQPYEKIVDDSIVGMYSKNKKRLSLYEAGAEAAGDRFCDNDTCSII